jgi:transcriptional regulator with XRE-family HTH domain
MSVIELHAEIRRAIAEALREQRLKQTDLADRIGISQGHISNALRGAKKRVSPWILDELAEAAGVEISATITTRSQREAANLPSRDREGAGQTIEMPKPRRGRPPGARLAA